MRITTQHAPVELSTIDLFDPGFYASGDPHAAWRALRAESPVHWFQVDDKRGFWAVTRMKEVSAVLRDFATFTSERGNILTMLGKDDVAGGKMLAVTDPPKHTEIKRQINSYFTPGATKAFEPAVRSLARRVIAPAARSETFDLAAASAFYPIAFTALVMGIHQRHWTSLKRFSYVAIADQDPEVTGDGSHDHALAEAHSEIFDYFVEEVASASRTRDDAIGAIGRARLANRPLSDEEKIYNLYSLLLGATVTTSHAMNAAILALVENPDQWRVWQEHGCTDSLVEEALRWASPANHFMRHAVTDVELGGTPIRAGDPVTVWLGSANRDEDVFTDPFRFDVRREPNNHIAFGVGAHRCLGSPMARLALQVFFEEIHGQVERIEPAGPVTHLASNFVAGIKRLPVRVVLRPDARAGFAGLVPLQDV